MVCEVVGVEPRARVRALEVIREGEAERQGEEAVEQLRLVQEDMVRAD